MKRRCWGGIGLLALTVLCAACAEQGSVATTPARPRGKALKIGVILPLSGKYKIYGESTLHGAECGAGLQAPCTASMAVELISRDEGGDPSRAAAAVTELVQQEKVAAIVGPMLSRTVEAAARQAQELKVPLISLSQRDGVAEIGEYVFRIGINAASQVETLAHYAIKDRGFTKIAIVYPNNTYGQTLREAFRERVTALGGNIVAEKGYASEIANVIEARNEAGPEDTTTIFPARPKPRPGSMSTSGEIVPLSTTGQRDDATIPLIPRVRGAEAVFIPDSYRNVLTLFKYGGPDLFGNAALLGVNRWNSASLLEGGSRVEGAVFVDAFFPESGDSDTQQFVRAFGEAFHMDPTVLEAQAYDAVRMVVHAAKDVHASSPDRVREGLARLKNFHGVTGRITFNAEGDAVKHLYLLTVRGGAIQEIATPKSAITQSALGRSLQYRTKPLSPSLKYDVGGVPPLPSSGEATPIRTQRGKYDPEPGETIP